jgi:hypothetical protein
MPKEDGKRFFDDEDFTSEHDSINIWAIQNWKEIIKFIGKGINNIEGKYEAEPVLEGYPPIFPDGIIIGKCWGEKEYDDNRCNNCKRSSRDCSESIESRRKECERLSLAEYFVIIIEIKPNIESFGKVLRQMNLYRERVRNRKHLDGYGRDRRIITVLISNDNRYDDVFRSQGIVVYHPPIPVSDEAGVKS